MSGPKLYAGTELDLIFAALPGRIAPGHALEFREWLDRGQWR
jgi:hypothetical protein